MAAVARQLRRAALGDGAGLTDGQLLERFVAGGDEDAFAVIVRRHGPMVLGVCRRILRDRHDAEDAFQATFLVLVRKAASVMPRELVANWLYGVACHTARKARAVAARRRGRERQVAAMPEPEVSPAELWEELRPLLDQELGRLPPRYRAPVVLCDLEGKTRKEAARQLGWPEGTVSGRLARARALLAGRLARQGLTLSAGALAAALAGSKASACVPASLAVATARGAVPAGAGLATAGGMISARALALAEGVVETMLTGKLKFTVVLLLAAVLGGVASRALTSPGLAREPGKEPAPARADGQAPAAPAGLRRAVESFIWGLARVDAAANTLSVRMLTQAHSFSGDDLVFHGLEQGLTWTNVAVPVSPPGSRLALDNLPLAGGVKVFIDGKEGKLEGLRPEMSLSLKLAADGPAVARIDARTVPSGGEAVLKAFDADARTITVTVGGKEATMAVAADALIATNATGKGGFGALQPGMPVSLTLGVDKDRIVVKRLLGKAEGG
jgi:RNA polymerase sigma factor (sigma-70 family)